MDMNEAVLQLQSQVGVALDQLRTLSGRSDEHAVAVSAMGNMPTIQQAIGELQAAIGQIRQAMSTTSSFQPNGRDSRERYLINPKDVSVDNFHGALEKFRDWLDDAVAYVDVIDPVLGEVLEYIATLPAEIVAADIIAKL